MMNPFKKSIIGSVLLLTSLIMHYNQYRDNGVFEIFSSASVFLLLGPLSLFLGIGGYRNRPKS